MDCMAGRAGATYITTSHLLPKLADVMDMTSARFDYHETERWRTSKAMGQPMFRVYGSLPQLDCVLVPVHLPMGKDDGHWVCHLRLSYDLP